MITRKMSAAFSALGVAALALAGCASTSGGETVPTDELTVGVSYMTLNNTFFDPMSAGAEAEAESLSVAYVEVDSRLDVAQQITGIENLIAQGVSGLVVNAVDSDAVVPGILAANDAGIPVVTLDVEARDGEVVAHVASDNYEAGKLAGEFVAEQIGDGGKVAVIDGPPITTFEERASGFIDAVEAAGLEVVAHPNATANSPEAFTAVSENVLTANPEIQYMFAVNDDAAIAAASAIEATGRADVFAVGVDGVPDVVAQIAADSSPIKATVGQQPSLMGSIAVQTLVDYLNGEAVESYVPVPLELVTLDNAAGFAW